MGINNVSRCLFPGRNQFSNVLRRIPAYRSATCRDYQARLRPSEKWRVARGETLTGDPISDGTVEIVSPRARGERESPSGDLATSSSATRYRARIPRIREAEDCVIDARAVSFFGRETDTLANYWLN